MNTQKGGTVWFTGLACSGKTTLAKRVRDILNIRGIAVVILDSDDLRNTVSRDVGYTMADREHHMKLVSNICSLLTMQGIVNIAAVISPTEKSRREARKQIGKCIEVYTKCSLSTCRKRDVKGHYRKFDEGKLNNFVGLDLPYEEPGSPDVTVETDKHSIDSCSNAIIHAMEEKNII